MTDPNEENGRWTYLPITHPWHPDFVAPIVPIDPMNLAMFVHADPNDAWND